jgi:aspartyl/asparaginyl beta-hydroxylase (cupin superfamily)
MYLHYVKNPTNQTRVVLYLDVKRINLNFILQKIIDFSSYYIENSYILQKFIRNQHMQVKNEE